MDEQKKNVDFSLLFDLADKLRACRDEKKEHEDRIKELNAQIETIDKELSDGMVEAECSKFSRNGKLFYLYNTLHASSLDGNKAAMFAALKKEGYGSLVTETVHAKTLESFVKEQMAANDGNLPDWLKKVVNAYEGVTVGIRKESTRKK